jgi:cell division protein FtsN
VETGQLPEEKEQPLSDPAPVSPDTVVHGIPETAKSPAALETPRGRYALQVGAYSLQENAEKQKLFFEDLGFPVEVMNKVKDTRSLYIVLVGNYGSSDEARAKGAEIKKNYNIQSMVVTR